MTPEQLSEHAYNCGYVSPDSVDPDYRYVVKLVLRATLFFRDGHTPVIRQGLRACFDDYFAAFGKELQWGWEPQPSGTPTPRHFDARLAEAAREAFGEVKSDDGVELGFMSSLNPQYVGDHAIECITRPNWEQALGRDGAYLTCWVPHDTVQDGRWDDGASPLHDFLLACCNRLKATHGYAGFALALPHEYYRWEPYELDLAQQYYGLEIDNPVHVIPMTQGWKGIKGVNWYTVLGNHYIEKLGGKAAIRARLTDASFRFYDFEGGLAIRAGDAPELGPSAEGPPPLYVAVNSVVRPVRTTEVGSFGLGSNAGELRFNKRLTDLWLRRFDEPGIWPPGAALRDDSPDPSASMTLEDLMAAALPPVAKSGESCPVSGKWAPCDAPVPAVELEQGQSMPRGEYVDTQGCMVSRDIEWRLVERNNGQEGSD